MYGDNEISRRAIIGAGISMFAAPALARRDTRNIAVVSAPVGRYRGQKATNGTERFLGIRYGQDTHPTRFRPPLAVADHEGTYDASAYAASCPQQGDRYAPHSEDCLFLNIWAPAAKRTTMRPVMVYFHGGAYSTGSVIDPLNDGAALAGRGDVIVVTVNHRLNALGYLYLAEIDPRFPDSGNAGQLDLILALKWVQRNISSFGGDPNNVTVFGQSGGGAKIATLMAMSAAKGLFHKAITMSGQQVTASGPQNATRRARAFLDKLGMDPETAPLEKLMGALVAFDPIIGGGVYMGPVLDMRTLERHPFYPDAAPQSLDIPMMLGNAVAEARAFFPAGHAKLQGLNWNNLSERLAPELRIDIKADWVVAQFRKRYPDYSPADLFFAAITTGRSWRGQVIEAEERAKAGASAFVYQLDFEQAKHTDDIGLSFGTGVHTRAQRAMSDEIMASFVQFSRTGNPGWAPYSLARRETMIFDLVSHVESDPRQWERELFARVPYVQPGT